MLILYVGLKYDYGIPEQGHSFEHYNFYNCLVNMGNDILYFDFMTQMRKRGQAEMNRRLVEVAKAEKPDFLFCVLFGEELDKSGVREISENTDTLTMNWFCDDHFRFDNFSRLWAPCFNWVITTSQSALPKYHRMGYRNVIKTQWACNPFLYRKLDLPLRYDVSFVGKPHSNRPAIIQSLRDSGIQVHAWGTGWQSGRLTQEEMIRVFNQSRINLNLSGSEAIIPTATTRTKRAVQKKLSRCIDAIPLGPAAKSMVRKLRSRKWHSESIPDASAPSEAETRKLRYYDQIKGRNFEVPGCGGFLLTGKAEDLEIYYEEGKEVVCFEGIDDLVEKARYYLREDCERKQIAESGYQRTLKEHTYVYRFEEIFKKVGLKSGKGREPIKGGGSPGASIEID